MFTSGRPCQACVDAFSKLLPCFQISAACRPALGPFPDPSRSCPPRSYFRMYATYCCNYPNVAEALCKVAAEHSGAATALVEAEGTRDAMDCTRFPERTRDGLRLPGGGQAAERALGEASRNLPVGGGGARRQAAGEISRDLPRSPEITRDIPRSP